MALAEVVAGVKASPTELQLRALWGKRTFDVVLSLPLCLLALPVIAILAAVLLVQHRALPLFVHDRIGHRGRVIAVPKLRTLTPDTHPYADKTLVPIQPTDRLSSFLRRSHLDELPQLFAVLVGAMSLVGPRPRMAAEAAMHGDVEYEVLRTAVPQGCTGLWQISGRQGRVSDHPEFDRFYVVQRTLRLDAWILWRTLRQALGGGGTELSQVPRWALRHPERATVEAH